MSAHNLGLMMDGLLLLFLAGTMMFAWRLSRSLNTFMRYRGELGKLVGDLGRNIDKAERAIGGLQNAARESGNQLQTLIDRATAISEELQMVIESAERMQQRPQRSAPPPSPPPSSPPPHVAPRTATSRAAQQSGGAPSFAIRDREMENREMEGGLDDDSLQDEEFTKAERELMAALRMGGKS